MSKEELQSYLEAHERRMEKRNVNKAKAEISLQVRFIGKDLKVNEKWFMNKARGNYHNNGGIDSQNFKRVKVATTKVVDQAIIEVATI